MWSSVVVARAHSQLLHQVWRTWTSSSLEVQRFSFVGLPASTVDLASLSEPPKDGLMASLRRGWRLARSAAATSVGWQEFTLAPEELQVYKAGQSSGSRVKERRGAAKLGNDRIRERGVLDGSGFSGFLMAPLLVCLIGSS